MKASKCQSIKVSEQRQGYIWCMARNMYIDLSVCIVYQARSAGECNGCEHYSKCGMRDGECGMKTNSEIRIPNSEFGRGGGNEAA